MTAFEQENAETQTQVWLVAYCLYISYFSRYIIYLCVCVCVVACVYVYDDDG
jgi:hypothetical protein